MKTKHKTVDGHEYRQGPVGVCLACCAYKNKELCNKLCSSSDGPEVMEDDRGWEEVKGWSTL
jgi:hypothetical protein